jgi:hypothetical protein
MGETKDGWDEGWGSKGWDGIVCEGREGCSMKEWIIKRSSTQQQKHKTHRTILDLCRILSGLYRSGCRVLRVDPAGL